LPEQLEPEDSPFLVDYYAVGRLLLQGISQRSTIVTVVCMPSFEPAWAIRLHKSENHGFAVTLTETSTQICPSSSHFPPTVLTSKAKLPTAIAVELVEIWRKMLKATFPRAFKGIQQDGVSYHFICNAGAEGKLCAQTYSRDFETSPGRLVSLSHKLREYASLQGRTEVLAQIESEMEWFRAIPIRPPLPENAASKLRGEIEKIRRLHASGIMTDIEFTAQIIDAFDRVRFPPVLDVLEIASSIPTDLQLRIRMLLEK
jgi:hypothetical protein